MCKTRILIAVTLTIAFTALPAGGDETQSKSTETREPEEAPGIRNLINHLKSTPLGKALQDAWEVFDVARDAYSAYEFFSKIVDPQPDVAKLIEEAKQEILAEVRHIEANDVANEVQGLLGAYEDYRLHQMLSVYDEMTYGSAMALPSVLDLIHNGTLGQAYVASKPFNLLVPLRATLLKGMEWQKVAAGDYVGDISQYRADIDHKIRSEFLEAIDVNALLLGEHCPEWGEFPEVPCYAGGKLSEHYLAGGIDCEQRVQVEQFTWESNEALKANTSTDSTDYWYRFSRTDCQTVIVEERGGGQNLPITETRCIDLCLQVSGDGLRSFPCDEGQEESQLWRLDFVGGGAGHANARVMHSSGMCLSADLPELQSVHLLPCNESGEGQIWRLEKVEVDADKVSLSAGPACPLDYTGSHYLTLTGGGVGTVTSAFVPWHQSRFDMRRVGLAAPAGGPKPAVDTKELGFKLSRSLDRNLMEVRAGGAGKIEVEAIWSAPVSLVLYLNGPGGAKAEERGTSPLRLFYELTEDDRPNETWWVGLTGTADELVKGTFRVTYPALDRPTIIRRTSSELVTPERLDFKLLDAWEQIDLMEVRFSDPGKIVTEARWSSPMPLELVIHGPGRAPVRSDGASPLRSTYHVADEHLAGGAVARISLRWSGARPRGVHENRLFGTLGVTYIPDRPSVVEVVPNAGQAPQYQPGETPQLLSPRQGQEFDHFPRTLTLKWSPVAGASGYIVSVWRRVTQTKWVPWKAFPANETELTFDFVGAQPGRWSVKAVYSNGSEGTVSEWREFRCLR